MFSATDEAEILWDSWGVPHIFADNLPAAVRPDLETLRQMNCSVRAGSQIASRVMRPFFDQNLSPFPFVALHYFRIFAASRCFLLTFSVFWPRITLLHVARSRTASRLRCSRIYRLPSSLPLVTRAERNLCMSLIIATCLR